MSSQPNSVSGPLVSRIIRYILTNYENEADEQIEQVRLFGWMLITGCKGFGIESMGVILGLFALVVGGKVCSLSG